MKSNSTFIYKCFILCIDSLALKSKRNRQKPIPGYPRCAYMKCHYKIRGVFSKPNETRCVLGGSFIVKDFLKTFMGWDGYDTHLILWAIVSTRKRVGYFCDSWNGLFFFLVNRDFIRSRKPWLSNIILREMRKKYLFFREPWFWLCLLLFSTAANNAA